MSEIYVLRFYVFGVNQSGAQTVGPSEKLNPTVTFPGFHQNGRRVPPSSGRQSAQLDNATEDCAPPPSRLLLGARVLAAGGDIVVVLRVHDVVAARGVVAGVLGRPVQGVVGLHLVRDPRVPGQAGLLGNQGLVALVPAQAILGHLHVHLIVRVPAHSLEDPGDHPGAGTDPDELKEQHNDEE